MKLNSVEGGINNSKIDLLIEKTKTKFEESMDDDLNISEALAAVFNFMGEINKLMAESKLSKNDAKKTILLLEELDRVLGILDFEEQDIPEDILELVKKREIARKNKDFKSSDMLREELKKKGYTVDDTSGKSLVKKI